MIPNICSSVNLDFRIAPSNQGATFSHYQWSEISGAGQRSQCSRLKEEQMPDFSHIVSLQSDQLPEAVIEIVGTQDQGRIVYTVRRAPTASPAGRLTWVIDFQNKSLRFEVDQTLPSAAWNACLTGCLIGLSGSLADCLLRAKSASDAWDCIDKNATATVLGAVGCVVGCLSGLP
jgi:hypothetical protein